MLIALRRFPLHWLTRLTSFLGWSRNEQGAATAVVAFASLFATLATAGTITVASGGIDFSAIDNLINDSFSRVSGTVEVRGSVIARATADGSSLESIQIPIRLYGEGASVPLASDDPQHLVVAFHDDVTYSADVPYSATITSGNGDDVLDAWETALLTIDVSALTTPDGAPVLSPGTKFTVELSAPVGGAVIVERRLPAVFQSVMSLY